MATGGIKRNNRKGLFFTNAESSKNTLAPNAHRKLNVNKILNKRILIYRDYLVAFLVARFLIGVVGSTIPVLSSVTFILPSSKNPPIGKN